MLRRCCVRRFFNKSSGTDIQALRNEVDAAVERINNQVLHPMDQFTTLVPRSTYNTPLVILLGNHSAGKSTFVNTLMEKQLQTTGVAPTDDGFTILMRGDVDMDEDGPTAVSNPAYGFQDLRHFGPSFVNHFRVKIRKLPDTTNVPYGLMLVDTPGMIDTPIHHKHSRTSVEGQNRGYDFLGVTRWFAQRADAILLMFDPANPGTTGETLDVLTQSLADMEHKFFILLNKVDMFTKMSDFARAYGTLCWNLSKVIPQKDIPRVYTTFIQVDDSKPSTVTDNQQLEEFIKHRREVIQEIMRAPLRRVDNLISEVEETTQRLQIASSVSNAVKWHYMYKAAMLRGAVLCTALTVPAGMWAALAPVDALTMALCLGSSLGVVGGAALYAQNSLSALSQYLMRSLDDTFENIYRAPTADMRKRWEVVKGHMLTSLQQSPRVNAVSGVKYTYPSDIRKLDNIMQKEIPELRKKSSEYKRMVAVANQQQE
jgi:GTPase SAR1 family protein